MRPLSRPSNAARSPESKGTSNRPPSFAPRSWIESRTGSSPAHSTAVAFSKDGKKAYVTSFASTIVSIINVETGTVTKTVSAGNNPVGVAVN